LSPQLKLPSMGNFGSKKNQKKIIQKTVTTTTKKQDKSTELQNVHQQQRVIPIRAVRGVSAQQFIFAYKLVNVGDGGRASKDVYAILCLQVPVGPRCGIFMSDAGKLGGIAELSKGTKYRASEAMVVGVQLTGDPERVAKLHDAFLDPNTKSPALRSIHAKEFTYTIGAIARSDKLPESNEGCGHGIHFFADIESAAGYHGKGIYKNFWPVITSTLRIIRGAEDACGDERISDGARQICYDDERSEAATTPPPPSTYSSCSSSVAKPTWPAFAADLYLEHRGFGFIERRQQQYEEMLAGNFGSVTDFRYPFADQPVHEAEEAEEEDDDEKTEKCADMGGDGESLERTSPQAYIGTNVYEHDDDEADEPLMPKPESELRHRITCHTQSDL